MDIFTLEDMQEIKKESTFNGQLDVVKAEFVSAESLSWQELFQGYNKLYAITYSSGISFVCKLLELFDESEIIFGSKEVMSFTFQEIAAYQTKTIKRLQEDASKAKIDLISRIDNATLKLMVAREQLSHEKIYILEANDGRKRVVMGSANMSHVAFSGKQRENICYMDGENAFDWYYGCYCRLKENSTDDITSKMVYIDTDLENLEELPIAKTVRVEKVFVIEPNVNEETREEIRFAMDVTNMKTKLTPFSPKPDKQGLIRLSPEIIKQTRRTVDEARVREKKEQDEYPQLVVNIDNQTAVLNDKELDLHPSDEDVSNDVELFIEYMTGFEKFHKNKNGVMQMRYFELANWFFVTPFLATIRHAAAINNRENMAYPVFGLVIGLSGAGKTTFLETLLKMMIGQKPTLENKDFTRSAVLKLRERVKGVPVVVDDLGPDRFRQHAVETIKNDTFGISEGLMHYPAIIISANEDVKVVAPEVARRTVVCRLNGTLKTADMLTAGIVRRVQGTIGTAFYREYLRRMLEVMPDFMSELNKPNDAPPDVLALSSKVICAIIRKYSNSNKRPVPVYVRKLTLHDYFNDYKTGENAVKSIRQSWQVDRTSFKINKRANQLSYNAKDIYEANKLLKELPKDLEAERSREWINMKLDKAHEVFKIDFRTESLLSRIFQR